MKQYEKRKEKIEQALFDSMDNADMGVNVQVERGNVTITGIVDTLSEKDSVEKITRSLPGVTRVDNSLAIGMDGKIDDDDISRVITARLEEEAGIATKDVGAVTNNGKVYLKGRVKTLEEKDKAEKAARSVMGVKEVINLISVGRDAETPHDDATLTNAVEDAFAASARVDAHDIKTLCKNGVIYLEGAAESEEEKEIAAFLAGTVPGVQKVINNITIER